ncbi:MAG: WD40/YVTN/BNR-like repeat-containing protein [Haloarculaceae archaeon]
MVLYAGLEDRILVVREEAGAWTAAERLPASDVECVAAASGAPERVFVGTVHSGLQRSVDGGHAWETTLDPDARVTAVTVSPHDADVVWAGTEPSRVYRSADGGDTWSERPGLTDLPSADRWSFPPRPHTHHVRWIEVDPRDPDRLYVAIEAGALVRTTDGGDTWQDHPEGARRDNHTLATHPDAPGRVYAAAGDGYAESTDGGDTWRYPQSGLDRRYVWGLAVGSDPADVVVSAASGPRAAHDANGESYVFRRTDEGWERAMTGLPGPDGMARAVLAADRTGFYALSNHGLFHSERGSVWDMLALSWPADAGVPSALAVA